MHRVLTYIVIMLWVLLLANETSAQRVMPVVKIYGEFYDEYTEGKIIVCDPDSLAPDTFNMFAKFRGGTSQQYEKKNYAVKLVDESGLKLSARLLGMRNDNSWILDAMAVDKARMRNRVAFDIWNAMDVKPYYYESEPKVRTGISGKFVELYLNDEYNGIYCLNEKLDRKQLKLKKVKDDVVRGVLYKGFSWNGTCFGDESEAYSNDSSEYQGFESVYPDVKDNGKTEWEPIIEKEDFVVNSSEDVYAAEYAEHFDVPMLMNLHIFINTIGAIDNRGKNQFFYIYDITESRKMSFAPWDLDSSFGRDWRSWVYEDSYDKLWFENHIITQINDVDKTFLNNVANLYFELRKSLLANDSIKSLFDEYFRLFEETGAAKRELARWSGADDIELNFEEEKEFIHQFVDIRMAFLDAYYAEYYNKNTDMKNIPIEASDQIVYDIMGRRVYNIQPGQVYIMNGRCVYFRK